MQRPPLNIDDLNAHNFCRPSCSERLYPGKVAIDFSAAQHWRSFTPCSSNGQIESPDLPDIFRFATEMDAFADAVRNDTAPRTPGEEGLRDLIVIEAIYKAAESGSSVSINQQI